MFVTVPLPVALKERAPSPKYSRILPVPPLTVNIVATFRIISFEAVHPFNLPFSFIPTSFGIFVVNPCPVIASTASAPPTPMAMTPKPPALGVWESVPIIIVPGTA